MQKKLIINADDLGLSEEVNRGIFTAHHQGIVTSATLMVTMAGVEHALEGIRGSRLDVGLHIDLSWGRPIAPPAEIPSLVGADGRFPGKKPLLKKLMLGQIRPRDLEREIDAQVKCFRKTGLALFHADVHQHFHGFPVIMKALAKTARAERIPFLRFVNEPSWTTPASTMIYLMFCLSRRHFPGCCRAADHFLGLALTGRLNRETLMVQLEKVQPGLTELMCHPGFNDPALAALSRLQSRETELAALTDTRVRDTVAAQGIVLTTFRDELNAAPTASKAAAQL